MVKLSWTEFKSRITDKKLQHQIELYKSKYICTAVDGTITYKTVVRKKDVGFESADQVDLETNYLSTANRPIQQPFSNDGGHKFRGTGVSGTATKNSTTNVDYKLTEDRNINGLQILLKDHSFGDSADFQVVDVDNVLGYGAGLVLDEFGTSWYFPEDIQMHEVQLNYKALINGGLYLRLKYHSTGTVNDVAVRVNYFLHKIV